MGRLERRRRGEKRVGKTKREVGRRAKKRSKGTRLGRRLKEGGVAEAVAGRGRKDSTAAQRPRDPATLQEKGVTLDPLFQVHLKKDTERRKEIKTERGIETEVERETGIETESKIGPAAIDEMTEIEILAPEKRRGTGREDSIQAA